MFQISGGINRFCSASVSAYSYTFLRARSVRLPSVTFVHTEIQITHAE